MITICHPVDDMESLFLVAALEAAEIPTFVVGQHFGSLYPGMKMPWYNEKSIQVPASCRFEALEIVQDLRSRYSPSFEGLTVKSKCRILIEALVFGWVVPCGSKKSSNLSVEVAASPRGDAPLT